MLSKDSKIYVAGHHGLVGSAIWNNLKQRGYNNLVGRTHKELDLTDQLAVKKFFDEEQPDAVVLAAAFVGGIMANSLYRVVKTEDIHPPKTGISVHFCVLSLMAMQK